MVSKRAFENSLDCDEVGSDGDDNHSKSKGNELEDDIAISFWWLVLVYSASSDESRGGVLDRSHLGTAGLMLDFSSTVSSWSRMVFSVATMRRVAIVSFSRDG
jgi:hypothetical protein